MAQPIVLGPGSRAEALASAVRALRGGGVALLPAEGVYGLHAAASNPAAVARLGALKPREPGRPCLALIAAPGDAARWAARISEAARALIRAHWPGALTLIFSASVSVPEAARGPGDTVALRCPGSDFLRDVVAGAGDLILSTSANEPGAPPAASFPAGLAARADAAVDAGALEGGPSTIVSVVDDPPRLVREGPVRLTGSRA